MSNEETEVLAPPPATLADKPEQLNMSADVLDMLMDRARRYPRDLELVQKNAHSELLIVPDLALSDKYMREDGSVFVTGVEAIVRLLLDKQRADRDAGRSVNSTYVTGYEGSPLGGLDLKVIEHFCDRVLVLYLHAATRTASASCCTSRS